MSPLNRPPDDYLAEFYHTEDGTVKHCQASADYRSEADCRKHVSDVARRFLLIASVRPQPAGAVRQLPVPRRRVYARTRAGASGMAGGEATGAGVRSRARGATTNR